MLLHFGGTMYLSMNVSGSTGHGSICCDSSTGQPGNLDTTDCISQWTQEITYFLTPPFWRVIKEYSYINTEDH